MIKKTYRYGEETSIESEMKISKSNELVCEMQHEVEKYTKLLELSKIDRVNTIKDNVGYILSDCDKIFNDSIKWLKMQNDKIDKRRRYEEKDSFEFLSNQIKEIIGIENIKIKEIMNYCYEILSHWIIFTIGEDSKKYQLEIPCMKKLTVENALDLNFGKLSISYEKSPSSWYQLCSSYDEKELSEEFKKEINYNGGNV